MFAFLGLTGAQASGEVVPPTMQAERAPLEPDTTPTTDPLADWYGPAEFQVPSMVTPEPEPESPILLIDAPDVAPMALWSPDGAELTASMDAETDEEPAMAIRLARIGDAASIEQGFWAYSDQATAEAAERAYLMGRFNTLPSPGAVAVLAMFAAGAGGRRRG